MVFDLKDGKPDGPPMTLREYLELHEEHRAEVAEAVNQLRRELDRS